MRFLGKMVAVMLVLMTSAVLLGTVAGLFSLPQSRSYVAVPAVETWAGARPIGPAHVEVAPGEYQTWPVRASRFPGVLEVVVVVTVSLSFLTLLVLLWRGVRRNPVNDSEERLMQELYRRSVKMEERLEALETLLLQQRTEARPDWAER